MMFEEKDLQRFEFNGNSYPYKCDLAVLEKIQNRTGDLIIAEDMLRGFKPRVDADGVMDRSTGNYTLPDIGLVVDSLIWMIEEGIDISGEELKAPAAVDLKRQDQYALNDLAKIVFDEFEYALAPKDKKKSLKTNRKS